MADRAQLTAVQLKKRFTWTSIKHKGGTNAANKTETENGENAALHILHLLFYLCHTDRQAGYVFLFFSSKMCLYFLKSQCIVSEYWGLWDTETTTILPIRDRHVTQQISFNYRPVTFMKHGKGEKRIIVWWAVHQAWLRGGDDKIIQRACGH